MDIFSILRMIGGLALFLYGMTAMGDGLAKMAGGRLESILEKLTSKRIFAVLLGAGVTAVIQSSSATTVMVVGFVNSGIMQLGQAVGIIMGANVGTTVTSWLLSLIGIEGGNIFLKLLKPTSFSPILAAVGIILTMTSKGENRKKDIGNILIGFAILMFGMNTMSEAVSPLANDEGFSQLFTAFSNPVLGMLVGAALTAIIQSSSASVGILQVLCSTGAVSYSVALPIIMGQNIGTCVTSIISSVGANKNAKRAAMIHLFFNLIGTILFMVVFYSLNAFIDFAFMGERASAAGVAVIHSLFNIGCCIVFYPFADGLVKLSQLVIRDGAKTEKPEDKTRVVSIDERFLEKPAFAMELCRNACVDMARAAQESIILALEVMLDYDSKKGRRVYELEEVVDQYEDELGSYLVKLSGKNLSKKDSGKMSIMLHGIGDFERISDHAINIVEAAERMREKDLAFSKNERFELTVLAQAVRDISENMVYVFENEDLEEAMKIEPLEEVIDGLTKKIKKHHIKRLQKGKCTIELGIVLEDILTNLERVSDHCSNVAVEIITIKNNVYDIHDYFKSLSPSEKAAFDQEYDILKNRYLLKRVDDTIKGEKKKKVKN